jgi:hypothetical protein
MIEAIPTNYRGVQMRSRLEARWALFMDRLRVEWVYEPELFSLPVGGYLPDFWLPRLDTYLEIKPHRPWWLETEKCSLLADTTRKRVILLAGPCELPYDPGDRHGFPEW